MKKHFSFIGLISLLLIIGIVAIGCSGGSPTSVVKKLHTAIEKGDSKAIGQLMTPEGASMMAMMGEKAKGMIASYGGIAKTRETIDGNDALVEVTYKNGETSDYELVKIDGKWKVTIDK
ncbi:MAG: DUF4878 domain-containing protein [Treponema sp.]|jgi:hypothetical protein|nr:DUF4878 domain-containing protein [Treponema sp.]